MSTIGSAMSRILSEICKFSLHTTVHTHVINVNVKLFLFLQYLMEGSYNKVFLAKGNIPAESYTFFIDILLDTIRYVLLTCIYWTL